MSDIAANATPTLETRDLTRALRSGEREIVVLDSVSIVIQVGEWVAIRGPSGSGKSTLLSLLAGLDRPTRGTVLLDGQEIQDLSEDDLARLRRQKVGFVFQSFQLLPHLTARENVLLPLELKGTPDRLDQANTLLDQVGLGERGHHYPSQLSGGEQQRVAVARAFAPRPQLLLADEPTGNLDQETGRVVLETITQLRQRFQTTVVMVTHDESVGARADREIHLEDGRVRD